MGLAVKNNEIAYSEQSNTLLTIISNAASNPDVDVEKLERLLALKERFDKTEAEKSFNASFSQMQSEIPEVTEKGEIKVGSEVRSKYAKFEDINKSIRPILESHGFGISFKTDVEDKYITVIAILSHKGGHRETTKMRLPFDTSGSKNLVQAVGSATSYAKRYALMAILNISTRGEDDDGKFAAPKFISSMQVQRLKKLMDNDPVKIEKFCNHFNLGDIHELQSHLYNKAETSVMQSLSKKA